MIVDDAVAEDVGSGDLTSGALPPDLQIQWQIEAQAEGVLCGVAIAEYLLAPYSTDPENAFIEVHRVDGEYVQRGEIIISGLLPARRVMTAERTALNFMMHLSGVATLTDLFVRKIEGTNARIVDTRKTLPMLRTLQKYAVRCGGGHNHRMGLYDGAMLKDNHIAAAGSIQEAVKRLKGYASHMTKIEVECETLDQVAEAIEAGADVILLDNMDPFMMREAVKAHKGRCLFEASGGINLDTVRGVAQTGVDLISVGALTHSAPSMPFHLEIV
ncbi:carboxylating nicotinate-nucleotide diphosphorylase [Fimbriimonas ginsengisoli]|nr:carboxylating nicotinate-nucleotide diphosphorylase [Fimbriimonas ginsengisoli]